MSRACKSTCCVDPWQLKSKAGFFYQTIFKMKNQLLIHKWPAILFAVLIFIFSSLPGDKLPEIRFGLGDKFIHVIEFGLFGIFLYHAFRFSSPISKPYFATLCVGIVYALLDEIHQLFVPGRSCEIWDFIADLVGIIIFAGLSAWINRLPDNTADKSQIHRTNS